MSSRPSYPTPYPDVNAVLDALLSGVRAALGESFLGLYLYGSLSSGDFDPQRSDIDFVGIAAGDLPGAAIPALEAMHARLAASGLKWAKKLEGSYLPRHALRRYDPALGPYPAYNEGRFYVAPHGSDWVIQRHILREHGVIVAGPPLQPLIDPVSPDDLRRAVRGILREWWEPMLRSTEFLQRGSEYQAFAVLTMCRALYTLERGDVTSKPVSARWAQAALDGRWSALIARALAWTPDSGPGSLDDTLDFIRYTLQRSQQADPG